MSLAAVFQIGSLGDSIVSVPVVRSLRDRLPGCSEYLLVSRFDTHMKVMPNHVFDMAWKAKHTINYQGPGKGLQQITSFASLLAKLRYYRPKHCVYLMPSDRTQSQVDRDKLFFKAGGVKELVGFRPLSLSEMQFGSAPSVQITEAYLRFRRVWGDAAEEMFPKFAATPLLDPGSSAQLRVSEWLETRRRFPHFPLLAICPYSNYTSKNLPQEMLAELIGRLEEIGQVEVVLVGGKKDHTQASEILAKAGTGLNACGEFTPTESAALLQTCSLVVTADSGPMHLAGALGVASVVVFSRINKELGRWFPLGRNSTILYRDVACAGCKLTACPLADHPCMRMVTLDNILSVVLNKLKGLHEMPAQLNGTSILSW